MTHLSRFIVREVSGSEILLELLIAQGVTTLFGYPGGAIMPVYDALYDYQDKLRHILVRHEQGAAHAAEGYARISGKAGVCIATSGPGATNLVTGIADAMLDSIPLVCITGQVAREFLGTDAFQETDVIGITTPITKWNYQVTNAGELASVIPKAFQIALSGRPGPVVIDITKNAQLERILWDDKETICRKSPIGLSYSIEPSKLAQAAELINNSVRPLLLIGHGVLISGAEGLVREFVEKTGIPVASTLLGLSAFPTDHPLFVGMLGMHGNYGPNVLTNKADLIIAVGMRFDDRVTGRLDKYARQAKIIHIDVDPAEIQKNVPVAVGIVSDAKQALEPLLPLLEQRAIPAWMGEFQKFRQLEVESVIEKALNPLSGKIRMSEVVHKISNVTNGTAIVVADVGQHQMITARYYRFKQSNSFVTSGGLGTMGFALPAAAGAAVACEGSRPVMCFVGDGGFQMTCQELGTIAQENLPVKTIILNNTFLGMVRQWQQLFFKGRYSFVHLENPDFIALSNAFRVPAMRVSDRAQLDDAIKQMMDTPGPFVLEVCVETEENVFPMVPSGASVEDVRLE